MKTPIPALGKCSGDSQTGLESFIFSAPLPGPGPWRGKGRPQRRSRQSCFVLQSRAEKANTTPQAMLCGGKSKTSAGQPISLELFTLHNSNRPSSAELLSEARQRADPSAAGMRWLLQNNTNHLILGDTPLQLSRTS